MYWKYQLTQWIWSGLDLLYPPSCGGCNRDGFRWCTDCQQKVRPVLEPVCHHCGLPLGHPSLCIICADSRPPYRVMRSRLVSEGSIRSALHNLKYHRNLALGDALARPLLCYLQSLSWSVDAVVLVPLGKKRMEERGYNQIGMVAMPLAALGGWEYIPRALSRTRETNPQVGLSIQERRLNVLGAFQGRPGKISGKVVLLIDDVATTSATMSACANAFLGAGARDIYALTFARALPHHGLKIV